MRQDRVTNGDAQVAVGRALRVRLVALSFLMLFVELALIRWTGSHVLYLSYFSNFVLLGSFLGIGVGFMRARSSRNLFPLAPVALVLLVSFVRIFPVEIDRAGRDLLFFGQHSTTGLPLAVTLPTIFVASACIMALIAEGVGRTFVLFEPLDAYRLDIVGSIAGTVVFSALSFLGVPPIGWGLVVAAVFVALERPRLPGISRVAVIGLIALLGRESLQPGEQWSPYYRVSTFEVEEGILDVNVNGVPHQVIMSLDQISQMSPIYLAPYEVLSRGEPGDVLVVGAGTGNDVAVALAKGARSVDAVEIDPRLYELGRELHPERPYDDPRVGVTIDDGRAFLERSPGRYDLIVFALPDSITLVSSQAQVRLESYLFTLEAIAEARGHLRPGGTFAMYNYYREQWLVDRLAGTINAVFGHPPCVEQSGSAHLALLAVGIEGDSVDCSSGSYLEGGVPPPVNDDYPFLYLRDHGIPLPYAITLLLILAASVAFIRGVGGPLRGMRQYVDLFAMGTAFLLLETKNVVQFALLFGTTWLVNALVFAGILLSVLAAIEVSRRVLVRRPAGLWMVLFLSIAVAWLVPGSALLAMPFVPRFAAAAALAFTPIFVANVVFAQRFRDVEASHIAFAANLLGAMVGGVLEYASLMVGYRSLLVVAALIYLTAYVFGRQAVPVPAGSS
ncbi:MAG TPA: spermidine synthase [Actinomycetota bacterium]|nr:spermidine synthase [Actinomycetota bacterium]